MDIFGHEEPTVCCCPLLDGHVADICMACRVVGMQFTVVVIGL